MDTATVVLFIITILMGILGFLETGARRRTEKDLEDLRDELREHVVETAKKFDGIKDSTSQRNESNNNRFSDLKELVLQKINDINDKFARLIK